MGIRFHTIEIKRGSSYIDSPQWLKNKKATINPKNTKDNHCFLYAIVIAVNHKEITNHPERIAKLIPFIPKYNWDDIDFPAGRKEWKTFERNNKDRALNILSLPNNIETIKIQYRSKYNDERKNQVALLMITDNKRNYHYLALKSIPTEEGYMKPTKSISVLFRDISKHNGDVYCSGCLHSFKSEKSLKNNKRLCNNHDYCEVVMPDDGRNTLQYMLILKHY